MEIAKNAELTPKEPKKMISEMRVAIGDSLSNIGSSNVEENGKS
jgi:hypothetical protein